MWSKATRSGSLLRTAYGSSSVRATPTRPYRVGDYWTIPARTATADIDWPHDTNGEPLSLPPQGPQRHYAPLAYVADENVCLQKAFRPLATGC